MVWLIHNLFSIQKSTMSKLFYVFVTRNYSAWHSRSGSMQTEGFVSGFRTEMIQIRKKLIRLKQNVVKVFFTQGYNSPVRLSPTIKFFTTEFPIRINIGFLVTDPYVEYRYRTTGRSFDSQLSFFLTIQQFSCKKISKISGSTVTG